VKEHPIAMQTRLYREQHGRIRRFAADLLRAAGAEAPAIQLRMDLARLSGSVKMHLIGEDEGLYPRLLQHADPEVRAKAVAFQAGMGALAGAFGAFYETWKKAGAIEADRAGFNAQLGDVLNALGRRMDAEDADLYALADRELAAA
jgi:hemerythrin HHE cation binding domain-containing protein